MASYYQQLITWQKAFELGKKIQQITKGFPKEEQYALTDQMRRAAISIASNIAEGSGRGSQLDYARFLSIAKGSANELETQILFAEAFGYIQKEGLHELLSLIEEILKLLTAKIKTLK